MSTGPDFARNLTGGETRMNHGRPLLLFAAAALLAAAPSPPPPTAARQETQDSVPPPAWQQPFVPDADTLLLLHADMGSEGQDASPTASHVGRYIGRVELCRGRHGQAFNFTDWSSRIEIPHRPEFSFAGKTAVTIEYWMKMYQLPRFMNSSEILHKEGMFSSAAWLNNHSRGLHGSVACGEKRTNVGIWIWFPPEDFDYTEWHHYAFVITAHDGSKPGIRALYIDGVLRHYEPMWERDFQTSAEVLTIGNGIRSHLHNGTQPFSGALDEIRVSTVARYLPTEAEIQALKEKK